ncbi:MAG: cell division protein FtsZ [Halobacteriovoraceae bacterium]|nr:cell division protein FtsZ [Halobacteriovoraceae bacterium]
MFEISNDQKNAFEEGAKIKVVGVGGGGCNAVNTMIRSGLSGVEYIVANTDAQALAANMAPTKVQLGVEITKGLGAGANPEVGRKAALEEYEKLSEVLEGADMVFITAGMGGGTGTGAAPVIAKLCKELGCLTVGVVTKPFLFEGRKRFKQADQGIQNLEESVDSLITIPNQRLLYIAGESLSLVDTFKKADEVLLNAVRGISDLINYTGHINADFADVKTVMENKGLSLMGTGVATGPDRAIKAATEAISSPLLEDVSIDGATGIIINITGNSSLTMHETNEAVTLIMEAADEEAEIIFGTVIDDDMDEDIKVTVVATGLGGMERVTTASARKQAQGNTSSMQREVAPTRSIVEPAPRAMSNTAPTVREEAQMQREVREQSFEPSYEERIETTPVQNQSVREEETREYNQDFKLDREVTDIPSSVSHDSERGSEQRTSSLMENIRNAATQYSENHNSEHAQENNSSQSNNQGQRKEQRSSWESSKTNSRAKSIAEKLGFINFDEEELDTPTYLRKEESNKRRDHDGARPLDM